MTEEALELLGKKAKDKVTGIFGVVTSISFDLSGCIQALVAPPVSKGESRATKWIDIGRLDTISDEPVMERPIFGEVEVNGPEDKPLK